MLIVVQRANLYKLVEKKMIANAHIYMKCFDKTQNKHTEKR